MRNDAIEVLILLTTLGGIIVAIFAISYVVTG